MKPPTSQRKVGHAGGLDILWDDGEQLFCRPRDAASAGRRSLLVVPRDEPAHISDVARLTHEFNLRDQLGPSWALVPLDLVSDSRRTLLVLEDPGAGPLSALLGKPMEVPRFLRLALALAGAVRQAHESELVHKRINPAHLLVDETTGRAWLTGFGHASRLPREKQPPAPAESIAGALAYISPEQTGRMNRSVDARSDLYSLGVVLYEMLTGAPPFTASEPMEWVHAHVARTPAPPSARVTAIPETLSELVMKLLAKTVEDRYQTATGLEHDLRRCSAQRERQGRIDPFRLADRDIPDRLLIPERLYGRSRDVELLTDAFDRMVATGSTELVLVSGYAGVGKSSLVNELQKALVPARALFASGKFDQRVRDVPYATLVEALQRLVLQLLSKGEPELDRWRAAIRAALGTEGLLIADLIPELELIVGAQPPVPDLPALEAQRRFHAAMRRFIGVFADAEHPLVLFLDDLQWLEAGTLDLIEELLAARDLHHLLL
ncbi:MAG TPA: AAA family ATPase, partial [Caulobacteraceae bacterium]|nr:AAA family ATPase [Caulobacteraceae bacterium]